MTLPSRAYNRRIFGAAPLAGRWLRKIARSQCRAQQRSGARVEPAPSVMGTGMSRDAPLPARSLLPVVRRGRLAILITLPNGTTRLVTSILATFASILTSILTIFTPVVTSIPTIFTPVLASFHAGRLGLNI